MKASFMEIDCVYCDIYIRYGAATVKQATVDQPLLSNDSVNNGRSFVLIVLCKRNGVHYAVWAATELYRNGEWCFLCGLC
jgi:hypothetical protein